jgi:hypothetical protein
MRRFLSSLFVCVCITRVVIDAQSSATPRFEVASVKQNVSDLKSISNDMPGTYTAIKRNARLSSS